MRRPVPARLIREFPGGTGPAPDRMTPLYLVERLWRGGLGRVHSAALLASLAAPASAQQYPRQAQDRAALVSAAASVAAVLAVLGTVGL